MKIFLGPAGIPTVTKKYGSVEGIKTVAELGLNAMEVEFVRGVKMGNETAKECGEVAKELGVKLTVHAPYYINLCSAEKEKIVASEKRILDSVERAHHLHADMVTFHAAYYGKLQPEQAYEQVKESCERMLKAMKQNGWDDLLLGLETTGKTSQFGTLSELINFCKEVDGCVPTVDFAHLFARAQGKIDYGEVFDKLKPLKLKIVYSHFSNIRYGNTGEREHLVIKNDQPPFAPVAKEILKRKLSIVIICESPVIEQDSLVMKKEFEKLGWKF